MDIYVYIYIYIYTQTYIYIYIYIHTYAVAILAQARVCVGSTRVFEHVGGVPAHWCVFAMADRSRSPKKDSSSAASASELSIEDQMKGLIQAMNAQNQHMNTMVDVMMGKFTELNTHVVQHQTHTSSELGMLGVNVKSLVEKFEASEKRVERVETELATVKRAVKESSEGSNGASASERVAKKQNTSKGPQGRGRWVGTIDMDVDSKATPEREGSRVRFQTEETEFKIHSDSDSEEGGWKHVSRGRGARSGRARGGGSGSVAPDSDGEGPAVNPKKLWVKGNPRKMNGDVLKKQGDDDRCCEQDTGWG